MLLQPTADDAGAVRHVSARLTERDLVNLPRFRMAVRTERTHLRHPGGIAAPRVRGTRPAAQRCAGQPAGCRTLRTATVTRLAARSATRSATRDTPGG